MIPALSCPTMGRSLWRPPRKTEGKREDYGATRRRLLEERAALMREYYLNHGKGCKSIAKAIASRTNAA